MAVLVIGLALFLGIHVLPVVVPLRARLYAAWGEARYKLAFSIASAIGLALIIYGWWIAPGGPQLFAPSGSALRLAPYAMGAAFVLLASSHSPSHIRAAVKHPMLIGVIIWALVHLLANAEEEPGMQQGRTGNNRPDRTDAIRGQGRKTLEANRERVKGNPDFNP